MDSDYKSRKEAFVSNLSGGSILEINAVTLVAPVSFGISCTSLSLIQCTNLFNCIGFCFPLVGAPIAALFFHTLRSSGSHYRLFAQRISDLVCDDPILLRSMAVKYSPDISGRFASTEHAASSDTDQSETSANRGLAT